MSKRTVHHTLKCILLCFSLFMGTHSVSAQDSIQWMTFDQLDDSLKVYPKKVFVYFYADWCTYCHKMDRVAFQDQKVATIMNADYYAVKMNIETSDTIHFGNQVFVNERLRKPNPVHQIPLLMASRKGQPFSLPAMVLLDEKFEAVARYFQYLSADQMARILERK
ncbi:MAG: thioredoxin fold domain-containing protein [Fulvivirga sp.]|uniref:thioredoxin family protein n=1 Tax=Fulvivirga sp. TaxID=1931237 RepID=UPI0032ECAAB5